MIDLSELSPEQLVLLIVKAKQILYPEAVIVGDELECSLPPTRRSVAGRERHDGDTQPRYAFG
jgi:hypothetical protein